MCYSIHFLPFHCLLCLDSEFRWEPRRWARNDGEGSLLPFLPSFPPLQPDGLTQVWSANSAAAGQRLPVTFRRKTESFVSRRPLSQSKVTSYTCSCLYLLSPFSGSCDLLSGSISPTLSSTGFPLFMYLYFMAFFPSATLHTTTWSLTTHQDTGKSWVGFLQHSTLVSHCMLRLRSTNG